VPLGNDQAVALADWVDIPDGVKMLVFPYNLIFRYLAERTVHYIKLLFKWKISISCIDIMQKVCLLSTLKVASESA
jgi:hypothetical protein